MPKKVAPVPKGYRTVTPQLVVRGVEAALDYYARVFGATVLSRVFADDGVSILQAELKIGNSILRLMDEMPAFGILSPLGYGGTPVGQHLYLANADEIWDAAVDNGAIALMPLADMPWGERYGKFADPFGHVWSVSRRISKPVATPTATADSFSVHEPRADHLEPALIRGDAGAQQVEAA